MSYDKEIYGFSKNYHQAPHNKTRTKQKPHPQIITGAITTETLPKNKQQLKPLRGGGAKLTLMVIYICLRFCYCQKRKLVQLTWRLPNLSNVPSQGINQPTHYDETKKRALN